MKVVKEQHSTSTITFVMDDGSRVIEHKDGAPMVIVSTEDIISLVQRHDEHWLAVNAWEYSKEHYGA